MHRILIVLVLHITACGPGRVTEPKAETPAQDTVRKSRKQEKLYVAARRLDKDYILRYIRLKEDYPEAAYYVENCFTSADGPACEVNKYYQDNQLIKFSYACGDCSPYLTEEIFYVKNDTLVGVISKETWFNYDPCLSEEEQKQQGITQADKEKEIKTRYFFYYLLDSAEYRFATKINRPESEYSESRPLDPLSVLHHARQILNECEQ
ncbi:MAG: hypothetical protein AB1458_08540 [Bacteroidota bacterium]